MVLQAQHSWGTAPMIFSGLPTSVPSPLLTAFSYYHPSPANSTQPKKTSHFKGKLRQNNITKQLEELLFSPSSAVPDAHPIFCHILPAYTVGFHPSLKFSKPLSSHIRAATPRCLITIR